MCIAKTPVAKHSWLIVFFDVSIISELCVVIGFTIIVELTGSAK